jgi:hypothetical protein
MRITRVLAAASAAVIAPLGLAAAAARADPDPVPPSGTALALTEDGDMVFGCNGNTYRFDLHGTAQAVMGAPLAGSESPTRLVTTRAEDMLGFDPVLGQITVTEREPARGELVSPVPGKDFPALASFAQDVTVAMEHTPCDDSGAPAAFVTSAPFALVDTNAKAFPPHGEVYNIVDPVAFHPVGEPDSPAFVTAFQFPVTLTKSS